MYEQLDLPSVMVLRERAKKFLRQRSASLAVAILVNLLLLYLFQNAIAWLIVGIARQAGLGVSGLELLNEGYTLLIYLVAFLFPYLGYARWIHYPLSRIPKDPPYPPVLLASTGFTLGLANAGMFLTILLSSLFALFGLYPPDLTLTFPQNPIAFFLFCINLTLLPALVEEFTYRGIVLGSLRPWGDRFAIGISALLFAFLHRNMLQFPNALLMGIALGYFMVKTNSLWTSIFIHFINNALVLLLELGIFGQPAEVQAIFALGQMGLYLVFLALGLWYFYRKKLFMGLPVSRCPLRETECAKSFLLHLPMLFALALYLRVIFFNFER